MTWICTRCGEHNRDGAALCGMCKAIPRVAAVGVAPAPITARGERAPAPSQSAPSPSASSSSAPPRAPAPQPYRTASHALGGGPVLVFLDPPHAASPDVEAVGRALGLPEVDTRMRLGLAMPSPVALAEPHDAERCAAVLTSAGVAVALPSVAALIAQPFEEEVSAFSIDGVGLAFQTAQGEGRFAWQTLRAAFLVSQSSFAVQRNRVEQANHEQVSVHLDAARRNIAFGLQRGARRELSRARALLDAARGTLTETTVLTLHLVARDDAGEDVHLVLTRGQLRYEGLGAQRGAGGQASWDALLAHIAASAPHAPLDRRAERAPPRIPAITGIAAAFGGRLPSASWIHGAFLSWRAPPR